MAHTWVAEARVNGMMLKDAAGGVSAASFLDVRTKYQENIVVVPAFPAELTFSFKGWAGLTASESGVEVAFAFNYYPNNRDVTYSTIETFTGPISYPANPPDLNDSLVRTFQIRKVFTQELRGVVQIDVIGSFPDYYWSGNYDPSVPEPDWNGASFSIWIKAYKSKQQKWWTFEHAAAIARRRAGVTWVD